MIKYIVMDVDGTLTDGKIYLGQNGEICKVFDVKDGYGIRNIAPKAGLIPVIITGRNSDIVANRCHELEVKEVYQGVIDKTEILCSITSELKSVAFIGDDINDLACMKMVKEAGGKIGCPANAVSAIKEIADFISVYNGGNGAVRDFIEWTLTLR
ncbi:MAG: 3-deoxy-D-manno-octulosonate 8-phosphate phosphatase [Lachnospiraceae bacterium]|nr:3-deoxy-D-manno-octulosonate 8-phosphate phosphatase [Lachnospiraceae bacterium]